MTQPPQAHITEAEYLEYERESHVKHEYFAGEIFAATGASEQHNLIASNVNASLHTQLRQRSCRVYPSDMRVKVTQTGLHTYPDITIVCGQPQFTDDEKRDTLLNPIVIFEILSPSTERYDRGMKFQHYRTIETLTEYILIAQDAHRIEHYIRHEQDRWILSEAVGIDTILILSSVDCQLHLADVYEKVEFSTSTSVRLPRDVTEE